MLPSLTAERSGRRRGAASVEVAVCLPLIILIVFGTIETCSVVFLQQNLQRIVYEAARVAASPYREAQDGRTAGLQIMDQLELRGGTVTIGTSALPGHSDISLVNAAVTLPVASNGVLPAWVLPVAQLSAQCTMVKEKDR